jgi:hypothetical protein
MAKWLCARCLRLEDQPIPHGTGTIIDDNPWQEEECGPWLNVTHVYRKGQAQMRLRAEAEVTPRGARSRTAIRKAIRSLSLEDD